MGFTHEQRAESQSKKTQWLWLDMSEWSFCGDEPTEDGSQKSTAVSISIKLSRNGPYSILQSIFQHSTAVFNLQLHRACLKQRDPETLHVPPYRLVWTLDEDK